MTTNHGAGLLSNRTRRRLSRGYSAHKRAEIKRNYLDQKGAYSYARLARGHRSGGNAASEVLVQFHMGTHSRCRSDRVRQRGSLHDIEFLCKLRGPFFVRPVEDVAQPHNVSRRMPRLHGVFDINTRLNSRGSPQESLTVIVFPDADNVYRSTVRLRTSRQVEIASTNNPID